MTSKTVQDMIVERRLEKVGTNARQAGRMLRSCTQHLETADQRAGGDPSGGYALLYAELATIADEHLFHLDRMRRTRNDSEYEERPITEAEVRNDLEHARFLVQAIARTLFPPKPTETK